MGISTEVWFPVVTLVAGAALGYLSDVLKSRHERNIRQKQDQDVRLLRLLEQQKQLLDEIEALVQDSSRNIIQILLADKSATQTGGDWGAQQLPEELSDRNFEIRRKLKTKSARVVSEGTRLLLAEHQSLLGEFISVVDETSAESHCARVISSAEQILLEIGVAVRRIDVRMLRSMPEVKEILEGTGKDT